LTDLLKAKLEQGATNTQLTQTIDQLKAKTGAAGVERIELLNHMFKGILD